MYRYLFTNLMVYISIFYTSVPSLKVPSPNSPQRETTQHITPHHQMTQVTERPITKRPRTSHYLEIHLTIYGNKYTILKLFSKDCSINRPTVQCTVQVNKGIQVNTGILLKGLEIILTKLASVRKNPGNGPYKIKHTVHTTQYLHA
jgi:hypothetical protein